MARSGGLASLAKDEHRDGFYQRKILWALSITNDPNRYCCQSPVASPRSSVRGRVKRGWKHTAFLPVATVVASVSPSYLRR